MQDIANLTEIQFLLFLTCFINYLLLIYKIVRGVEFFITDLTLAFAIPCISHTLSSKHHSKYQQFQYQPIFQHRKRNMPCHVIAERLNKKEFLTLQNKHYKSAHVWSILQKKSARE